MKKMLLLNAAYAFFVFFWLLSMACEVRAANLIQNGSYEDGTFSPIISNSWVNVAPGGTKLTGWTVGMAGIDWHQNSFEIQSALDGQRMVDLNLSGGGLSDSGTISQSFQTTPGASYVLTFHLAGPETSFPNPRQVRVNVAGIEQTFAQAASHNLTLVWGKKDLAFVATASTTTLMFSSVNGSGFWGPFLDDVRVEASTQPIVDHYRCYTIDPTYVNKVVTLKDQFQENDARVVRSKLLCAPVSKNGEPVSSLDGVHLEAYHIQDRSLQPATRVRLKNQFGTTETRVKKPVLLLVPTEKEIIPPCSGNPSTC